MTQEEIYNGNVEIAKMLGEFIVDVWFTNTNGDYYLGKCYTPNRSDKQHFCGANNKKDVLKRISDHVQHFHKDWEWLMNAVEFIETNHKYTVKIYLNTCTIQSANQFVTKPSEYIINSYVKGNKKQAVFIAVSQFAKMYNNKLV